MRTRLLRTRALLLPAVLGAAIFPSRPATQTTAAADVALSPVKLPFEVGERLTYQIKLSAFNAGTTTLAIDSVATVRGRPAFHTVFDLKGRVLFKKFENH